MHMLRDHIITTILLPIAKTYLYQKDEVEKK